MKKGGAAMPIHRIASLLAVLTAAVMSVLAAPALAQSAFPSKPLRIIMPVTTGGPSDLVARLLARELETALGKPVLVDNRPGASQTVGANAVAKAEPDGHTLLQAAANMAINPFLMGDLPYDTVKDFAPVTLLRALAVTTPQRNAVFPNIPTAMEQGVSGYDFASWGGLFAPANTPRAVVMQLNAEVRRALTGEALRKRFDDMGLVAKPSSPGEFGAFLQSEMARWKGLVKRAP